MNNNNKNDIMRDLGIAAIAVLIFLGIKRLFDTFMEFFEDMSIVDEIEKQDQEDVEDWCDDLDDDEELDREPRRKHKKRHRRDDDYEDDYEEEEDYHHEEDRHNDLPTNDNDWYDNNDDGHEKGNFNPDERHEPTPEPDHTVVNKNTLSKYPFKSYPINCEADIASTQEDIREVKNEMESIKFLMNEILEEREASIKAGNMFIRNLKFIYGFIVNVFENGDRDDFYIIKCEFSMPKDENESRYLKIVFMTGEHDIYDRLLNSTNRNISICGAFGKIDNDGYMNFYVKSMEDK